MPQRDPAQIKKQDIYGKDEIDFTITIRERLLTRFKAHEHVQVKNIDNEDMEWQYVPDYAEQTNITDEGTRITTREDPELWYIEAGQTDVLIGACAFIFFDKLIKTLMIKQVGIVERPDNAKQIRNFNFKDPMRAEKFIDEIFMGKVSPSFNQTQANGILPEKPKAAPVAPPADSAVDEDESTETPAAPATSKNVQKAPAAVK